MTTEVTYRPRIGDTATISSPPRPAAVKAAADLPGSRLKWVGDAVSGVAYHVTYAGLCVVAVAGCWLLLACLVTLFPTAFMVVGVCFLLLAAAACCHALLSFAAYVGRAVSGEYVAIGYPKAAR